MTAEQTNDPSATSSDLSRRGVFRGVAVAGLSGPLLAACGAEDEPAATPPEEPAAGAELTTTSDVPSGGGVVLADQKIVVTQPTDGEFKAFTAVCTHQGCLVSNVKGGTINCNCHGSKYNIEDGSVETGPATQALAAVPIAVEGDEITLA